MAFTWVFYIQEMQKMPLFGFFAIMSHNIVFYEILIMVEVVKQDLTSIMKKEFHTMSHFWRMMFVIYVSHFTIFQQLFN